MKRLAFLVGVVLMCSGVFADISISEPLDVYNLGDRLYIDLAGLRGATTGNLDIDLSCENKSINMVRIPARAFSSGEDQTYSIPYKVLDWEDLGILNLKDIVGTCQIISKLGNDVASSKTFEISDDILVNIALDKMEYNPGETVNVKIGAVKDNGVNVNGFAEAGGVSSFSKAIEEGVAQESFAISETAESGLYELNVRAYDVGNVGVMNDGTGTGTYFVRQVATSLILSLSDVQVVPGNNFSIGVEVFDQSGIDMVGSSSVKIVSPDDEEAQSVVQTGDFVLIDLASNSSVGTWRIVSQFDDLVIEREFEMLALQKVDFDFEEAVLIVRNTGNVLYNKTIDVLIGEDTMTLDLKIGIGEVRKFSLEAPVGNYEVVVGDGDYEVSRQVLLTGNAISVSDLKGSGFLKNNSIVWIFFIVVFGGIGGILVMRFEKTRKVDGKENLFRKMLGKLKKHGKAGAKIKKKVSDKVPEKVKLHVEDSLNFTKKSPASHSLDVRNYSHEDKTMVDFTKKGSGTAEAALVLKGEKHISSVVCLGVKNFEALGDVARNALREVVEKSRGKGLVDYRSDYVFILFSPLATRTYKNEGLAVKCGAAILENLKGYNKKFRDKMEFGIGVHAGDLIASKEQGKLKYTGIGNTISFAKRMSDIDSGKVVVSDVVRKKLMRELGVVKGKEIGDNQTYVLGEIKNRSGDAERLKQLLKRQGE